MQSRNWLAALEAGFRLIYDILDGTRYVGRPAGILRIEASVRMLAAALCRCDNRAGESAAAEASDCIRRIRTEVERLCESGALSAERAARARDAVDEMALHSELALGERMPPA